MASAAASLLAGTAQAQSLSQTFLNVQDADNYQFSPAGNNPGPITQGAGNVANLIDKATDDFSSINQTFGNGGNPADQDALNELSTTFGSYRDFEQTATNAGNIVDVDDVSATVRQTAVGRQDADNLVVMGNTTPVSTPGIDFSQVAANSVNLLEADQVGATVTQRADVNQDAVNSLTITKDDFRGADVGNTWDNGELVPDQIAANTANLVDIDDLNASSNGIGQTFSGSAGQFASNDFDTGGAAVVAETGGYGNLTYTAYVENLQQLAANSANIVNVDDLGDGVTQNASAPQTALNNASFSGYFTPGDGINAEVGQAAQNSMNVVSADDLLNGSADIGQTSTSRQRAGNMLTQLGDTKGVVVNDTYQTAVNTANLVQVDVIPSGVTVNQTSGAGAVQTASNGLTLSGAAQVGNFAQTAGNYSNMIIDPPSN
jgi:hypothetical protein